MKKIYSSTAAWLKAVTLLVVLCVSGTYVSANTTTELELGELMSGRTYTIPANTHATATFNATSDGVVKLTSSLGVNYNFVPYSDAEYSNTITCERDEVSRTKSFSATEGTTYYFQCSSGINAFDVTFEFEAETVVAEPTMTITPAGGATKETAVDTDTFTFTVKFDGVTSVESTGTGNWIELVGWGEHPRNGQEGWYGEAVYYNIEKVDDTTFTLVPIAESLTEGVYQLYIESGEFWFDGDTSKKNEETYLYYNYTGGEAVIIENNVTVTPENNSKVDKLSTITLAFEKSIEIPGFENGTSAKAQVYDAENNVVSEGAVEFNENDWSAKIVDVKFSPAVKDAGTYTVKIPAGAFDFDISNTVALSPEYTFTYTVTGENAGIDYTITLDPAPGKVEKLTTFTLTFNGVESATPTTKITDYDNSDYLITLGDWNEVYTVDPVEGSQTSFILTPMWEEEFTIKGTYKLNIPEGGFYFNGDTKLINDAYSPTYTIEGPKEPTVTYVAEPAAGNVSSLEYVALTFTPSITSINDIDANVVLTKGDEVLETIAVADLMLTDFGPIPTVSANFSKEYTEIGTYTITFPAGFASLEGGLTNEEIKLTYNMLSQTGEYNIVVNPAEGTVSELRTITVTYEGVGSLSVPSDIGPSQFPYYGTVNEDGSINKVQFGLTSSASRNTITMSTTNTKPITTPGKYAVVIPAGYVEIDGVLSTEDVRFDYTIEGESAEFTLVADPEAGDVLAKDLYEINITFEGAKAVEFHDMGSYPSVYAITEDGKRGTQFYGTYDTHDTGFTYTMVSQHRGNLVPGKYQFIIPINYATITGSNDVTTTLVKEIVIDYTVIENENQVITVIAPTPEQKLESLYHFEISFEGATEVVLNEEKKMTGAYLYQITDEGKKFYSDLIAMATPNGAMLDVMAEAATEEGEYLLVIESGLFNVDGLENKELNYTYYIEAIPVTNRPMEIDVEEGIVDSLKDFTLTFPDNEVVEIYEGNHIEIILFTSQATDLNRNDLDFGMPTIAFEIEINGNEIKLIGHTEVTAAGNYYLIIPEGFFLVDGKRSAERTFEYHIAAGVEGIFSDAEELNVYNVNGVLILRNAKASDLKQLDNGIYIVNGKKIFLTK